jgi:hypothetical protein
MKRQDFNLMMVVMVFVALLVVLLANPANDSCAFLTLCAGPVPTGN